MIFAVEKIAWVNQCTEVRIHQDSVTISKLLEDEGNYKHISEQGFWIKRNQSR